MRGEMWFGGADRAPVSPRWRDFVAEGCSLLRDASQFRAPPVPGDLPNGDGHTVLVIPALFSCDRLTRRFRETLGRLNYRVEGWGAGINLGPTPASWACADALLRALATQSGRPVSLVGHSLGGVFARALAREHPELVRRVITICSPFRLPTASPLAPVYRGIARWHLDDEILLPRVAFPPPVPTTAIYSPCDGVVAWSSCIDLPGPGRENVAIAGRHATMLANPDVIRTVAERLARL